MEVNIRPRLSHSNSFGNDAEKDTAGCRALDRKYIVIGSEAMETGMTNAEFNAFLETLAQLVESKAKTVQEAATLIRQAQAK